MSVIALNSNLQELARKRKRESHKHEASANSPASVGTCFTNSAFSSTPKKLIKRRRKFELNKENVNTYVQFPCLEIKSIADLVQEDKRAQLVEQTTKNPYEVVRKPPKKKKRQMEIEEACFENPALNLEMPEKQFNPYEVLRETTQNVDVTAAQQKCFINEALNLRGHDVPAMRNPFEIPRLSVISEVAANPNGVENLAMEDVMPTSLSINLPFTPTVGCRIDFKNLPLSELTPSKLLAEKLVFSPVVVDEPKKRSLEAITEESSMDIGKELDQYQLELENSINEAKLRKHETDGDCVDNDKKCEQLIKNDAQKRMTFRQKLAGIAETEEDETVEKGKDIENLKINKEEEFKKKQHDKKTENCTKTLNKTSITEDKKIETTKITKASEKEIANDDVAYATESEDEDDIDFKAPSHFVRAYRKTTSPKLCARKESINSNKSNNSNKINTKNNNNSNEKTSSMKNLIRNSIRKLVNSKNLPADDGVNIDAQKAKVEKTCWKNYNEIKNKNNNNNDNDDNNSNKSKVNENNCQKTGIINSIRQSLRHKTKKQIPKQNQSLSETEAELSLKMGQQKQQKPLIYSNISIIDTTERIIKLKSNFMKTEPIQIENEYYCENKQTLRNSIRRSTRGLRQQVMKSVFHKKQEAYDFNI